MTQSFFLARHGNTFETGHVARRIGSRTDLPLTAEGRAQADRLGRHLALEGGIARVMCGSLVRTAETAQRVASHLGVPIIRDVAWLDEIDHGPDEGRAETDVLARVGEEALRAWDREAILPDGWIADSQRRIDGWRRFLTSLDRPMLLITSNGASRFLFKALPSLPRPASLSMATGAYGRFETADGEITAYRWNIRPPDGATAFPATFGSFEDEHGTI